MFLRRRRKKIGSLLTVENVGRKVDDDLKPRFQMNFNEHGNKLKGGAITLKHQQSENPRVNIIALIIQKHT